MIEFIRKLFKPKLVPKQIVMPSEHKISFKSVDPNAVKVLQGLHKHGHDAYLVGGVIRDTGAGVLTKDCDVVTSAKPNKVVPCFKRAIMIGKRFRLVHVFYGRQFIEVSTFRAVAKRGRVYAASGMIKRDNVYGKIHDDVMRRDFTINALYLRYPDGAIVDYLGGWEDLQNRSLKSIGPAKERFLEDPIRILRAIRFTAKIDLQMEKDILQAIEHGAKGLLNVPAQRLFVEVVKMYYSGYAKKANELMWRLNVFQTLFPDLMQTQVLTQALVDRMSAAADKRYVANEKLSVAYLVATMYWAKCEAYLKHNKIRGFSTKYAREVLAKSQMDVPPRVVDAVVEIWYLQYLFKSKERALSRVKKSSRLRAAFDLLSARATFEERLTDLGFFWESHV